ncbi:hypothetical protein V1511DRAFT_472701 [Dipodascopsis uninucleata]
MSQHGNISIVGGSGRARRHSSVRSVRFTQSNDEIEVEDHQLEPIPSYEGRSETLDVDYMDYELDRKAPVVKGNSINECENDDNRVSKRGDAIHKSLKENEVGVRGRSVSNAKSRMISRQNTSFKRSRSKSEPQEPFFFRRISSAPETAMSRPRRGTVSNVKQAVGGAIVGITNAAPTSGVMATAFIQAAEIPLPKEIIRQNSHQGDIELQKATEPDEVKIIATKHFTVLGRHYLKLAFNYITTPMGFLVTVYFCLVIAFGGMLFLILVGAAPAMNHHDGPNGTDTPGKRWIEIDSQVLNALFCITGIGLMPWRTRDLYLVLRGECGHELARIELARIHDWYHPAVCKRWKLNTVIILYMLNSVFQVIMAVCMWVYNRHNRPPWITGACIGLGFCSSGAGGLIAGLEKRRARNLKKIHPEFFEEDPEHEEMGDSVTDSVDSLQVHGKEQGEKLQSEKANLRLDSIK